MSVTTGVVRASFAHVYQAVIPLGGGDPKYSITLLIPKSDASTLNALSAEIERVKQANAQQFGGQIAGLKTPLYDGDGTMPSGTPWGEECRGCMVLRASSKEQPAIVDANIQPLLEPNALYSGCFVRASVNFYTYNQPMNKGIGCGLNAVQKIADGEPLANRITPEEAFGGTNTYQNNGVSPYQAGQYQTQAVNGQQRSQLYSPGAQATTSIPSANINQNQNQNQSQPSYSQYPEQQIDPITGTPVVQGGVMGI